MVACSLFRIAIVARDVQNSPRAALNHVKLIPRSCFLLGLGESSSIYHGFTSQPPYQCDNVCTTVAVRLRARVPCDGEYR
jgi:hypothetical protein